MFMIVLFKDSDTERLASNKRVKRFEVFERIALRGSANFRPPELSTI